MDVSTLKIDKKEVLRYAGHRGDYVPDNVEAAAEKMCGLILQNISPKSRVIQCAVQPAENGVVLGGSRLVLQGRDIKKHLDGCAFCYVLCATIGYQADMFIRSMQVQSALDGLMADAAATAAIEAYCDLLENRLRSEQKRQGKFVTWRYSPGYGDFPFEQQPQVLNLLQAEKYTGIHCNRACMMIPSKSVTAVMGIANKKPRRSAGKCAFCPNKGNCNFSCR